MDTRDDDLNTTLAQVAECVKSYTWQMIYAKTDAEYDKLLAEFRAKAKEIGYDICVDRSL